MININDFDSNLLKIDKKSNKNIDMYYIRYITKKWWLWKYSYCNGVYNKCVGGGGGGAEGFTKFLIKLS